MKLISVQSSGNRIANVQNESVRGKSIFLFVGKEISPWEIHRLYAQKVFRLNFQHYKPPSGG